MKWDDEAPKFGNLYNNKIKNLFKYDFENNEINQNHMDLAHSIQKKYEEVIEEKWDNFIGSSWKI